MITVIIPFHNIENQNYLDLCLKSLNSNYIFESLKVVVISSAEKEPEVDQSLFILDHNPDLKHFSQKINYGISKYPNDLYLIGNDDLVFSKMSIACMSHLSRKENAVVNPMSNCDDINFYKPKFYFSVDKGTEPVETIEMMFDSKYQDILNDGSMKLNFPNIRALRLKFFCTMIPHSVISKVGLLDENYTTGWEDVDYCVRCREKSVPTLLATNAYVHHFSSKSIYRLSMEEKYKRHIINQDYFLNKWQNSPFKYIAYL